MVEGATFGIAVGGVPESVLTEEVHEATSKSVKLKVRSFPALFTHRHSYLVNISPDVTPSR